MSSLKDVQVEDLLERQPIQMDEKGIASYLTNRIVLVTGAGGSIGSELCRQIAKFKPQQLVLLGHGENSIYDIYSELNETYSELSLVPVIVDIKDAVAIGNVFMKHWPQVVFHAAAHKHVSLMEENPVEAVKNNVVGTWNMTRTAHEYQVGKFMFISTDKAVNPTSIMGGTKRIAEMLVQETSRYSKTVFSTVRFGNVLGSRGSVFPLFKKQIAKGGPVTVTHSEMSRYFMTIPEAAQLAIQAGVLARGGETFVLDMGEPVKILDLAERMIRLSGYASEKDIDIEFIGIRPGEKLYEEVLTPDECPVATCYPRILVTRRDKTDFSSLKDFVLMVGEHGWTATKAEVVLLLRKFFPSFSM